MKTLQILLCSLMILGCSTRKKALKITEFRSAEIERINLDSIKTRNSKEIQKKVIDRNVDIKDRENSGDIIIHGKTDSLKDFSFYNVVNGDTLSGVHISGTSDFTVKTKWKDTEKKASEKENSENTNIIEEAAHTAVSKKTIKEVVTKAKDLTIDVKNKGVTFGAWFTWSLWFVVVACLVWLYYCYGGKINWKKIIEKIKS